MTDERGVLRRIAWRELFPWLIIFRTFRLSISPTLLAVATSAVLLSYVGWWVGSVFLIEKVEGEWKVVQPPPPQLAAQTPAAVGKYLPREGSSAVEGYFRLADPIYGVFRRDMTVNQAAYYVFVSLWSLAVWALAGGIITRRAVVEFGAEETPGFVDTVKFAARRYLWYLLAPIYPLAGVMLLLLPIAGLGLLARITDLGVIVAGILWIFVVLAGLIAAWLLAGLLFGFPLMWGTISAEREGDAFEAFSRSFSYVYGKPLHYLFYAVVAALFGALCLAVVDYGARLILEFGFWSYSWGAGGERTALIMKWAEMGAGPLFALEVKPEERALKFGALLIALSVSLVRTISMGLVMSYFWCVAGAIYLLLRQDVDDKELDDVYIPAETPSPHGPLATAATPAPEPTPVPVPTTDAAPQPDQGLVETVQAPPQ
jgi:hypothetical protein